MATHDRGTMPITTHLYLVSAQATPNLTPALDPATRPRRVILLVSADMRGRARWLETVLTARGTRVESWGIDDPWDLERIQTQILELLEREKDQVARGTLALNATGGTKTMSIAAYEAFRAYDLPIFYVHPERDRLIWLHPGGMPARDLENRLRLEPFLQAHGARVTHLTREGIPPHLSDLTHWLASQARTFAPVLGTLNYLARVAASLTCTRYHPAMMACFLSSLVPGRMVRIRVPGSTATVGGASSSMTLSRYRWPQR